MIEWDIKNNETRIILTTNCNYKCIFCHNEGFDPYSQCEWQPSEEKLIPILQEVIAMKCKDITITGGEPLLYKNLILKIVEFLTRNAEQTSLTIVTNASLITKDWVDKIKHFKMLRFNVSLHTANELEYSSITGQNCFNLESIKEKLNLLRSANIPFKLNCVALKSTMTKESILDLITFSEKVNAKAIKIIELLILENNTTFFDEFIANESIAKRLPKHFTFVKSDDRKNTYKSKRTALSIELQKCRCQFGCNKCLKNTTTCINANGEFFPCFEFSDNSINLMKTPMNIALKKGMNTIKELADQYGDNSPSLIKSTKFVLFQDEALFEVLDSAKLNEILSEAKLEGKRAYEDHYFHHNEIKNLTVHARKHLGDLENSILALSKTRFIKSSPISYTKRKFQDPSKPTMKNNFCFIEDTVLTLGWNKNNSFSVIEDSYFYEDTIIKHLKINQDRDFIFIPLNECKNRSLINNMINNQIITLVDENIDSFFKTL